MGRKTQFTVNYQGFFFFLDLLIQQPETVLHVLKDNMNLSAGQGQESLPPQKE